MADPSAAGRPTRQQLDQWDRKLVWHAFTQMAEYEPLIIERAEGCVLFDIDGRRYLDGVSSLWCNVHGHRHPAHRRGHPRATRPRGPRHEPGQLEPHDHPAGQAAGRSGPAGPGARLLLRRRRHGRGSGPEDGLSVLAAAAGSRGRKRPATWPWARPITATRWGRVSVGGVARFHAMFRAAAVRDPPRCRPPTPIACRRA